MRRWGEKAGQRFCKIISVLRILIPSPPPSPRLQNDTDELAAFRSQWRQELGLPLSAGAGLNVEEEQKPGEKEVEQSADSKQSSPRALPHQDSPPKPSRQPPSSRDPEQLQTEVCS